MMEKFAFTLFVFGNPFMWGKGKISNSDDSFNRFHWPFSMIIILEHPGFGLQVVS